MGRTLKHGAETKLLRICHVYSMPSVSDEALAREWKPRQTQIFMVELLGAVAASDVHSEQLRGKFVTLLVDSEPVEGCLGRKDIPPKRTLWRHLDVGAFWDLVRRFDIVRPHIPDFDRREPHRPALLPRGRGRFVLLEQMGRVVGRPCLVTAA